MVTERFDSRTLANMEVALELACKTLATGAEEHRIRRYIAGKILKCADGGNKTVGDLTKAGLAAPNSAPHQHRAGGQGRDQSDQSAQQIAKPMSGNGRCIPKKIAKSAVLTPHVSRGLAFLHGQQRNQKSASCSLAPKRLQRAATRSGPCRIGSQNANLCPRG